VSLQTLIALFGVLVAASAPTIAWGVFLASRIERVADRLDDRLRSVEQSQREVVHGLDEVRQELRLHLTASGRQAHR
jgi:deoxyadenosine/deoxycytidine kinase